MLSRIFTVVVNINSKKYAKKKRQPLAAVQATTGPAFSMLMVRISKECRESALMDSVDVDSMVILLFP
jgi:hypothetical protein